MPSKGFRYLALLLMEEAGLGDDLIFIYGGEEPDKWISRGIYLKGVGNNAYVLIPYEEVSPAYI